MGAWNPAKGNRKAGTKPSPKNWRTNKMVVPQPDADDQSWYRDLRGAAVARYEVHGKSVGSLFQQPRDGFSYGCTPEDVAMMLNLLPADDVSGIKIVAFRQPTRKQWTLHPAWGRLVFYMEFNGFSGTCLMLEASKVGEVTKYPRKQVIETTEELERMRSDGHQLVEDRRGWTLVTTEESIRRGVLYRTVPHEVGHYVDFKGYIEDPRYVDISDVLDAYWARPAREREDAAHRYSFEKSTDLRMKGLIPFESKGGDRVTPPVITPNH